MFIALTGLHCSGKSYFLENFPSSYGFQTFKKKDIVKKLFLYDVDKVKFDDSHSWYNYKFESNPYEITADIVNEIYKEDNLILDSVHSNLEWEIIKMMVPNAKLIEFVTPKKVREERWVSKYKLKDKDSSRVKYWHNPKGTSKCLISDVDWVFNGVLSNELNLLCFEEFISFFNNTKYKDSDIEKTDVYDRILIVKGLKK